VRKVLALGCLLVLGSSVSAAAPTGSAPSFARARVYPIGAASASVATGDLDGDGKADLATANWRADTVSVLLNRTDGRFGRHVDYPTGPDPWSVAMADLNGDRRPDLATTSGDVNGMTVSVLLNRGDGSFAAHVDYKTGQSPQSVAIGDLNGDGSRDLVTANSEGHTLSVLLNRGDGSFAAKVDYEGVDPWSVAIGDLNGDDKPDLSAANFETNSVSVFLNSRDGTFQAGREYGTGIAPSSMAMGDLNGDGRLDLATANSESVSVLTNKGDGTFRAQRHFRAGLLNAIAIGDLNADGKPDLVGTNDIAGLVTVLVNRGDGSFEERLDYRVKDAAAATIGNLNGDGRADVAGVLSSPSPKAIFVLINTPGLCTVQNVKGKTLPVSQRTITRANCRAGKIRRSYSNRVKKGQVISQKPRFGAVLQGGGKVNLVVSRGRKPS